MSCFRVEGFHDACFSVEGFHRRDPIQWSIVLVKFEGWNDPLFSLSLSLSLTHTHTTAPSTPTSPCTGPSPVRGASQGSAPPPSTPAAVVGAARRTARGSPTSSRPLRRRRSYQCVCVEVSDYRGRARRVKNAMYPCEYFATLNIGRNEYHAHLVKWGFTSAHMRRRLAASRE